MTVEQIYAQLKEVTQRIVDLALFQYELPPSFYKARVSELYERKRAVLGKLHERTRRAWGPAL
jgi:hypothetical protein